MRQNLTALAIDRLPFTPKGNTKVWDASLPAFGVRVTAKSKSFFVMTGRDRRLQTIGRYPDLSLAEARKQAKKLLAQDRPQAGSTSLADALTPYYEDCQARLSPRAFIEYRRHLERLPSKKLSDFTRRDVDATKPHAVNAVKVFFNWCIKHDLIETNPFAHIPVKYGQRERILSANEIKTLWLYEYPPYSDIVKLLLLTGQRRGETMAIQPDWIKDDTVTLPSHITKNRKEHTFPFGSLTAQYLEKAPFSFNGWGNGQKRMYRNIGFNDFVLHDLRRTCASIHVQLGTPVHVTEAILNHSSGSISGVAKIYIRTNLLTDMREAILNYETYISSLVHS